MDQSTGTWISQDGGARPVLHVRKCRYEVIAGPDEGLIEEFAAPVVRIGRKGADLVLSDRSVSGLHAEVSMSEHGYRLRDLESSNGTFTAGMRVRDIDLTPRSTITVGQTQVRFVPLDDTVAYPLWNDTKYVSMVGKSWAMRNVFELIDKVAPSEATVLIHGETGTGKELVAEAIHQRSPRAQGPFVVLDCSAIPHHLMEDQLFGHVRGAFTGAINNRAGVFERAHGGTLFLDEIGELPPDAQSKLLRAVESRTVRPRCRPASSDVTAARLVFSAETSQPVTDAPQSAATIRAVFPRPQATSTRGRRSSSARRRTAPRSWRTPSVCSSSPPCVPASVRERE